MSKQIIEVSTNRTIYIISVCAILSHPFRKHIVYVTESFKFLIVLTFKNPL